VSTPRWHRDAAGVVVRRETAGENYLHRLALDRWDAVPGIDAVGPVLLLPSELWDRLGHVPSDEALVEEWRDETLALHDLLGLTNQRLLLRSRGFVGGASVSFDMEVDGRSIDSTHLGPIAKDEAGEDILLTPASWAIVRRLDEGLRGLLGTRAAQLAWLGGVRKAAHAISSGLGVPPILTEDAHLAAIRVVVPSNYRLAWEPRSQGSTLLDLKLYVAGEVQSLDLFELDAKQPVLMRDGEAVVLDSDAAEVARVAQRRRGTTAKKAGDALRDPSRVIPEGIGAEHIDLSAYGERVLGFEEAVAMPQEREGSGIDWQMVDDGEAFLTLEVHRLTGETQVVEVQTVEEAKQWKAEVSATLERKGPPGPEQSDDVMIGTKSLPATPKIEEALDVAIATYEDDLERLKRGGPPAPRRQRRLVVRLDDADLRSEGDIDIDTSNVPWEKLEAMFAPGVSLRPHQRKGVAWLWSHWKGGEPRGVLLADDMGLGKTFQIACILALRAAEIPRLPSLVVAPVILLENWADELRRFFVAGVFDGVLALHGEELASYRRGDRSLDLDRLRKHDVVLTNYHTLEANQQSLLQVDWAIVALDEAQAIKNPITYRSRAARALKREFAIAATGTPVENQLSDLWSIFDFASPGAPFSDLQAFRRDYERPGAAGIRRIRERLRYPHETSKVLRREKSDLRELPRKNLHTHLVPMTPEQVSLERQIVRNRELGPLAILQRFQKLYQHPELLRREEAGCEPLDLHRAMATSPKLTACLSLLDEIRARGEKALVFTLWVRMQAVLSEAIRVRFGLARNVPIINGDPANRVAAKERIRQLTETDGFGVLVLSPLAAGSGLNIQCANHVIHYGRWWNPAKEDQATDRAYRIGQTRDVNVHHLLLHWPNDNTRGFDVKLHALVEGKRAIAHSFLEPAPDSDVDAGALREEELGVDA
jgi:hypothetical protein